MFGKVDTTETYHAHVCRRRLRLAPRGSTRRRGAPRPRGDALSRVRPRRPSPAAVDPVSVGSCGVLAPRCSPVQAFRSVAAPAVGETHGGPSVGHPTSHGNQPDETLYGLFDLSTGSVKTASECDSSDPAAEVLMVNGPCSPPGFPRDDGGDGGGDPSRIHEEYRPEPLSSQ